MIGFYECCDLRGVKLLGPRGCTIVGTSLFSFLLKNWPIPASFSIYFRLFHTLQFKLKLKKALIVCLGFEPGAAGCKARTNPLSYGGTPEVPFSLFLCIVIRNSLWDCYFLIKLNTTKWFNKYEAVKLRLQLQQGFVKWLAQCKKRYHDDASIKFCILRDLCRADFDGQAKIVFFSEPFKKRFF